MTFHRENPTTIRGVTYPSQDAAAAALGVSRSTVSAARQRGTLDGVGMGRKGPRMVSVGDDFSERFLAGEPVASLASDYGCSDSRIIAEAKRRGLSRPKLKRGATIKTAPKAQPTKKPVPEDIDTSLVGDLVRTKGSYTALSGIAAREGWTQTQVLQEFHRARAGQPLRMEAI